MDYMKINYSRDFYDEAVAARVKAQKTPTSKTKKISSKKDFTGSGTVDFKRLNSSLLGMAENFLTTILPSGKIKGKEYLALNPHRIDKKLGSFSINRQTGSWKDFATGDQGKDLVSLYAYVKQLSNVQAAREILGEWNVN